MTGPRRGIKIPKVRQGSPPLRKLSRNLTLVAETKDGKNRVVLRQITSNPDRFEWDIERKTPQGWKKGRSSFFGAFGRPATKQRALKSARTVAFDTFRGELK